jgi:hypothetical protein
MNCILSAAGGLLPCTAELADCDNRRFPPVQGFPSGNGDVVRSAQTVLAHSRTPPETEGLL